MPPVVHTANERPAARTQAMRPQMAPYRHKNVYEIRCEIVCICCVFAWRAMFVCEKISTHKRPLSGERAADLESGTFVGERRAEKNCLNLWAREVKLKIFRLRRISSAGGSSIRAKAVKDGMLRSDLRAKKYYFSQDSPRISTWTSWLSQLRKMVFPEHLGSLAKSRGATVWVGSK